MTIGEKIFYLRKKHNLTLEQVGNSVGVGKSTVRKWENGDIANMRRDKIAKLATALHTTPAYLMGWKDEENTTAITDKELKVALFGGEVSDEMLEDVRKYADLIMRANQ